MGAFASIRMSSKGQIVIPKSIRNQLGLKEGDTLIIASHSDLLLLKKLTLKDIMAETDRQYQAGQTLSIEEAFAGLV